MIVDTSAIMAIVLEEPEGEGFLRKIGEAPVSRMSVGSWMELSVVLVRRHPVKIDLVESLLRHARFLFEPVTVEQAAIGKRAYQIYGQGTRHPARLNFGDCFAYALAKATGEPLLFKGDDFAHTDVRRA